MTSINEKPRPNPARVVRIVAVFVAVGIVTAGCCFTAGGIWLANNPLFSHTCYNGNRAQLEKFARFKYPADASDIHEDCDIWMGATIKVWFVMDASDLDSFLESTVIKPPLKQQGIPPDFGPPFNDAMLLHGGYFGGPGWESGRMSQDVWVDTSNPVRYRVYLKYAEPD